MLGSGSRLGLGLRLRQRLGSGFEAVAPPAEERELGQALDRDRERRAARLVEGEAVDVLLEQEARRAHVAR
eukprot:scaffold59896_cov37-Phaeocystis_antarctica.AAC.2